MAGFIWLPVAMTSERQPESDEGCQRKRKYIRKHYLMRFFISDDDSVISRIPHATNFFCFVLTERPLVAEVTCCHFKLIKTIIQHFNTYSYPLSCLALDKRISISLSYPSVTYEAGAGDS